MDQCWRQLEQITSLSESWFGSLKVLNFNYEEFKTWKSFGNEMKMIDRGLKAIQHPKVSRESLEDKLKT